MNPLSVLILILGVLAISFYAFRGKKEEGPAMMPRMPVPMHMPSEERVGHVSERPDFEKVTPISGVCTNCGKNVTLPFRCSYCKGLFCSDHRLPEDHNCDAI